MQTPAFWTSKNTLSTLLLPPAMLYDMAATLRRAFTPPATLSVPVICVGNLTAGGSGKTPVALAVAKRLKEKNIAAFFLSRGYGGAAKGPLLVDPALHAARDVGDEPLLLARELPTVIAKNRVAGARFAVERGAKAIVMDDGFQNPSIDPTLSFIVIDGTQGFGNFRLLPAGPLRERPQAGFARAHAAIVINRSNAVPELPPKLPVLFARTEPEAGAHALKGKTVLAFCGLAWPQKFFETLAGLGARMAETVSFADHYLYTDADLKKLALRAMQKNALLVTTAKDAARMTAYWRARVTVVEISLSFHQPELLDALLDAALKTS